MANVGIYREQAVSAGLPLPRRGLLLLTILLAVIGLAAIAMPPCLLAIVGHGAAGGWRLFKDGGGWMWLLLLLDIAMPVALTVLGAFVLRGKRVPSGLLFAGAALPFSVALFGAWSGGRLTLRALSGEGVDPEQKARILAEGIAESMSADIFGGLVVCGAALVAAAAAASAVASIDVPAITRGGPKPPAFGAIGAAAAGIAWFVATIGLGIARTRTAGGPIVFLVGLPILVLVPYAALAGRGAAVLKAWHDRAEASRAAGAIVVAALSALLAVLALERAIDATFLSRALGAISGESIDDSQRARILGEAVEAGRMAWAGYAVSAVLGAATFGFALAPSLGGSSPVTPSAAISAGLGAFLVAATFALAHSRMTAPAALAAIKTTTGAPPGVTLPVLVDTFSHKGTGLRSGDRIGIAKDGTRTSGLTLTATACARTHLALYADRAATVSMIEKALPCVPQRPLDVVLVATRDHPADIEKRLGPLAGFLGHTGYLDMTLDGTVPSGTGTLRVRTVADDAIEIDGARVTLPLPAGAASEYASGSRAWDRISKIHYAFRPNDTVDQIVATIVAAESLNQARLSAWDLERIVTIDDGRPPPAAPTTSLLGISGNFSDGPGNATGVSIRQGSVTVNGRLPPEVIQRIVRQNFGRFRLCYENGLRSNASLHGRVSVKFVIDKTGAVSSSADAGSDLPDKAVVACMVKTFSNLSFPSPEGGIVTVVYPLTFSPNPSPSP